MKARSLAMKLILSILVMITILMAATFTTIVQSNTDAAERTVKSQSRELSSHLASQVDAALYEQFLSTPKENDVYWKLRETLDGFRLQTGALYVYTMGINEQQETVILIDGQPRGSDVASPIGEVSTTMVAAALKPVFQGESISSDIVNDEKYGEYLTAASPIRNQAGQVIGVLGIDMPANTVHSILEQVQAEQLPSILLRTVLFLLIFTIVLFVIVRSITRPLKQLSETAKVVANGDLRKQLVVRTQDEVGELTRNFNEMVASLRGIVGEMNRSSEQVSHAAQDLLTATEQSAEATAEVSMMIDSMAQGAYEQVAMAERSGAVIHQMVEGIHRIEKQILHVAEEARHSTEEAEKGTSSIYKAEQQMVSIEEKAARTARTIGELREGTQEISRFLTGIQAIAAQTNMLALNAGIEAARAGEHGRGFQVVAEEVRKLSEQSRALAAQIAERLTGINDTASKAVEDMVLVSREIEDGQQTVAEAGLAFTGIVRAAQQVARQIKDVTEQIGLLTKGTAEVAACVKDVAGIAEHASAFAANVDDAGKTLAYTIDEIAASAESLNKMAVGLRELVDRFTIDSST